MKILAIETSCDETGIALLNAQGGLRAPKFSVVTNLVASQIPIHRLFGGVVPNLAKREHLKNLPILYRKVFGNGIDEARLWKKIDLLTVTVGPGLEPALWAGIEFAKMLSKKYKKRLIGANHLEGHLYSFLLPPQKKTVISNFQFPISKIFPAVALIVSGGHTVLLRMESFSKWRRLGETRDDAAGEAFDKVARLLGLPYPGGPEIEELATTGDPNAIAFPRPMLHEKNYDFSFSGLKTAVLYYLKNNAELRMANDELKRRIRNSQFAIRNKSINRSDVAASFQQAAVHVLVQKTMRAAEQYGARAVILCGGVAANKKLRHDMQSATKKIGVSFFAPRTAYNFDNAAMIGAAGYMAHCRGKKYPLRADGTMDI
jgi:N6-L-threonylcarbamoyladenine synthase